MDMLICSAKNSSFVSLQSMQLLKTSVNLISKN